eukprot:maker-scaffold559_size137194-snap-gene-0.23 protein:Tk04617 transcript:maker-scaffold559_size137194-snap-gene-0.23-mRNA-1 annotation:"traf-interacting protein"
MQVHCSTCLEPLSPSDELSSTPCGHVFHYTCILRWLATGGKASCPQCRSKCREAELRRIYMAEGADLSMSQADPRSLQSKIDSLTFQVRCADTEKKKAVEERENLKAKNVGLMEEFRDLERKTIRVESELATTKNVLKYAQHEQKQRASDKRKAEDLQEKLDLYQNIDHILKSSVSEVNQRLHSLGDYSKASRELSMIIEALKKEMVALREDKGKLRKEVLARSKEIVDFKTTLKVQTMELSELRAQTRAVTSDLEHAEAEIRSLKGKNDVLQSALDSPSGDMRSSTLKRLLTESPAPAPLRSLSDTPNTPLTLAEDIVPVKKTINFARKRSPDAIASSALGEFNILKRSRSHFSPGDWTKMGQRSRMATQEIESEKFYDGLGGHSKVDVFPQRSTGRLNVVGKKPKGVAKPKSTWQSGSQGGQKINQFFSLATP